ncbi:hypothetical protein HHI36_001452 [Cryptolaemus montrouzieri]|uniref:Uncharacterized protein n=1 Tax=Cryptolaemus montrouzieri TaxID=559131 RepID=A0ABD2P7Q8_9CUCU
MLPLKRLTIGNCKKTWVSDVVKRASMDLKNLYWLKVNLNSTSLDLEYRQAKKNYRCLLRETKYEYMENRLNTAHNKNKTVWSIVNEELGKSSSYKNQFSLCIDGVICSEPKMIVSAFGEYFSSVNNKCLHQHFGNNISQCCTSSIMKSCNFFFSGYGR